MLQRRHPEGGGLALGCWNLIIPALLKKCAGIWTRQHNYLALRGVVLKARDLVWAQAVSVPVLQHCPGPNGVVITSMGVHACGTVMAVKGADCASLLAWPHYLVCWLQEAKNKGCHMLFLPECFSFIGSSQPEVQGVDQNRVLAARRFSTMSEAF